MEKWQLVVWRAIPSAAILFRNDFTPVPWSVIADVEGQPVLILHDQPEVLAKYIANTHNLRLAQ